MPPVTTTVRLTASSQGGSSRRPRASETLRYLRLVGRCGKRFAKGGSLGSGLMVSPDASGTKMVMFGTKPAPVRELRAPTTLTLLTVSYTHLTLPTNREV